MIKKKNDTIKLLATHSKDVGSTEIQIGLLTDKISKLAEGLKGSEIIKIAGEVNALKAKGEVIYNQTIGDFDANIFPIPQELKQEIVSAYNDNQTNYPAANGMEELRESVSVYLSKNLGLDY